MILDEPLDGGLGRTALTTEEGNQAVPVRVHVVFQLAQHPRDHAGAGGADIIRIEAQPRPSHGHLVEADRQDLLGQVADVVHGHVGATTAVRLRQLEASGPGAEAGGHAGKIEVTRVVLNPDFDHLDRLHSGQAGTAGELLHGNGEQLVGEAGHHVVGNGRETEESMRRAVTHDISLELAGIGELEAVGSHTRDTAQRVVHDDVAKHVDLLIRDGLPDDRVGIKDEVRAELVQDLLEADVALGRTAADRRDLVQETRGHRDIHAITTLREGHGHALALGLHDLAQGEDSVPLHLSAQAGSHVVAVRKYENHADLEPHEAGIEVGVEGIVGQHGGTKDVRGTSATRGTADQVDGQDGVIAVFHQAHLVHRGLEGTPDLEALLVTSRGTDDALLGGARGHVGRERHDEHAIEDSTVLVLPHGEVRSGQTHDGELVVERVEVDLDREGVVVAGALLGLGAVGIDQDRTEVLGTGFLENLVRQHHDEAAKATKANVDAGRGRERAADSHGMLSFDPAPDSYTGSIGIV